jgi:hypothetical protein
MRGIRIALFGLIATGFVCACNHKACKRICECADDNSDECVDDCEDNLDEFSKDCQRETRSLARCLDFHDCDESECEDKYEDWTYECMVSPPPS